MVEQNVILSICREASDILSLLNDLIEEGERIISHSHTKNFEGPGYILTVVVERRGTS